MSNLGLRFAAGMSNKVNEGFAVLELPDSE